VKFARCFVIRPLLAPVGLLLALLTACARPEDVARPAQLLPKEKMVSLLVQLHILEARVENSHLSPDSARALFQSQKQEVLRQNNMSDTDSLLPRSYRYYAINRKDMDEIYTAVIDSLTRRETKMEGGKKTPPVHP
jgi:hypothetical protein